jgi:hypothetical protein
MGKENVAVSFCAHAVSEENRTSSLSRSHSLNGLNHGKRKTTQKLTVTRTQSSSYVPRNRCVLSLSGGSLD